VKWNTDITVKTKQVTETSELIRFKKGLPQEDALCPRLLTLCSVNPVAWKLLATEGYRLSKPIDAKITDLLYIDDLKIYASSEGKLKKVMEDMSDALRDIGLNWKKKKKKVRGNTCQSLKDWSNYKFLGVLKDIR